MPSLKRRADVTKACVACGCCVKVCPKQAISVHRGIQAIVKHSACVGCGKCANICPAGVIVMREEDDHAKTVV